MGLSTPIALLAAALVALPIVAHLVRRADVERRVLPTVALLERVVARDRRRARITEPWLLALRVAAVIAAALALAGPFVVDRLAYGDGSAISLVLVIDDSASMAQRADAAQTTAIELARDRARAIVRDVGEGSELAIVLGGAPPRLLLSRTTDRDAALAALDRVQVGARPGATPEAVAMAARQLASAHLADRRVVVLSDFAGAPLELSRGAAQGALEIEPIRIEAARDNVGIAELRAVPDPLEAGAWSATVELAAFGDDIPARVAVRALALAPGMGMPRPEDTESAELARADIALASGHGRATLRFRPPEGVLAIAVALDRAPDASAFDDVRVASLRAPHASRVVLVEPAGARTARFALRALSAVPEGAGAFLASAMDVDHLAARREGLIDPEAESRIDPLADADVLVLSGVVPSSPSAIEAIRAFVDGGGGLLLATGADLRAIDLDPIAELLPARVLGVEVPSLDPAGPVVVRGEGPALLPAGPTGLEGLALRSRRALTAPDAMVSLRSGDGAPLLVVDDVRRRAVLGVGLDDEMSDLPLRVGFVPLLASLGRALARPGSLPDRPFLAGEVPPLRLPPEVARVEIVTPTGEVLSRDAEAGVVALDDLAAPGAYALRIEEEGRVRELERAALVIVAPADEIDLRPNVPALDDDPGAQASEGETRVPVERYAFLLVGILAVLEGFARIGRARLAALRRGQEHRSV